MKRILVAAFCLLSMNLMANFTIKENSDLFLVELYKNLDKEKLSSKNEEVVIEYLTEKNIEIKEYLVKTYPEEKFEEIDINDPGTFILGLVTAIAEENKFQPLEKEEFVNSIKKIHGVNFEKALPGWVSCSMSVIGGMFDIYGLYQEYVALFTSTSTTWGSVATVVQRTLRRHFGWLAAAYLVYEIATSCF